MLIDFKEQPTDGFFVFGDLIDAYFREIWRDQKSRLSERAFF